MSDDFHRAKLSPAERNFRSQLARLVLNRWFLRGTLSERLGKCGKPNCRCTRGELQVFVPGAEPERKAAPALCPAGLAGARTAGRQ